MIHGAHDPVIIALSVAVAIIASYTALYLGRHIRESRGWLAYAWLATAAIAMGGGIWCMHFVAMLAFSLPGVPVRYDINTTLLSLALPIAVTGFGFWVVRDPKAGAISRVLSGVTMGFGISGMHYTGMAAMRMPATLLYDVKLVAASIAIAITASIVALWLAFRENNLRQKILAATVMGVAISGMHYTAMAAAMFLAHPDALMFQETGVSQLSLALSISAVMITINLLALGTAAYDSRHRPL